MDILEKLYDVAEENLFQDNKNWVGFALQVKGLLKANLVIFQTWHQNGLNTPRFELVTTTDRRMVEDYMNRKMLGGRPYNEINLAPMEPIRRSDLISDSQFTTLPRYHDFIKKHDYFYHLYVPARLTDGSYFNLMLWRGQSAQDFDNKEKQRLALLMRYLSNSYNLEELIDIHISDDIEIFGEKYGLTPTETEILGYLLEGHTLRTISKSSGRSYGTVRWHVQHILEKCHVKSQKYLLREFYQLIKA